MKLTSLFITALAAGATTVNGISDYVKKNVRNNLEGHRVISFHSDHVAELRALLHEHDADHFGSLDDHVHVKLSPEGIRALEAVAGHVTLEDRTEEWIEKLESRYNDPNFFCHDGEDACSDRDLADFYSSYQDIDAINKRIKKIAKKSNGLAKVGNIGKSFEGRKLKVIKIGDKDKPMVFYMCNIHAREWLPPMYCTYMAETLVNNGEGHQLLDRFQFVILPSANPDGYVFSMTSNSLWRKTRKPNPGTSCVGTDGNRNWDDHHCGEGASTSPCSAVYCGVEPFDQPETAAISKFTAKNKDKMFSFADIHSYGGYWMSPWGWTEDLPPAQDFSRMEACFTAAADAVRSVNGLRFIIGSSANAIYIAAGGSDDWHYSALDVIYSFSVELRGNEFQPPASNIMPSNEEIFAGMQASLDCAYDIEFEGADPAVAKKAGRVIADKEEFPVAGIALILAAAGLAVGAVVGAVSLRKMIKENNQAESEVKPVQEPAAVEVVPVEQIEKVGQPSL